MYLAWAVNCNSKGKKNICCHIARLRIQQKYKFLLVRSFIGLLVLITKIFIVDFGVWRRRFHEVFFH